MRFAFGEEEVRRIAKAVKAFEQGKGTSNYTASGPIHTASHLSIVKVTTPGTPYSSGKCVDFIAETGTYAEKDNVIIKDISGKTLTTNSYHVGYFAGYKEGEPVFFVTLGGDGGGTATIEVVTDVICTPTGLEVSTATFAGANYDTAILKKFLSLTDVIPKSFLGNQGRVVRVNETATGLEFGPVSGELAQTFIALDDTPLQYGKSAYKVLIVDSGNDGVTFADNNITTLHSVTGGGNPNDPTAGKWVSISLENDTANPGKNKYYGTNLASSRGWYDLAGNQETAMSVVGDGSVSTPIKLLNDEASPAGNYMYGTTTLGVKGWVPAVSFDYVDPLFDNLDSRVSAIESAPYATQGFVTTAVGNEATDRNNADIALDGRITTLETTSATHETYISTLQGDVSSLQSSVLNLIGVTNGHETDINALQSELSTETTNRVNADNALDGRVTSLESSVASINSSISTINTNITTIQGDISSINGDISTINTTLKTIQSNITTLQTDVTTLQTGLSTAEGNIVTLQSDVATLQSSLTSAEGNITTLQSDVSALQSGLSAAESSISTLQSDLATAQSDIATLQSDLATAQSDIATLQSDLATAQSDIATLQSDYTSLDARVTALEGA